MEKLTRNNMTWAHFAPRKRYIKNDAGETIETRYDRLFIGLRPAGRAWLENKYTGDDAVMVFMLGQNTVVFTHKKGETTIYVNSKAGAQAREYVAFYRAQVAKAEFLGAESIELVEVDDFPTQVIQRTPRVGVESLDAAIEAACMRNVEGLEI